MCLSHGLQSEEWSHMSLDRILSESPRWMFLLILVYAPWAFGCTDLLTMGILNQFSAALVLLWLGGCVWRGSWPDLPWLPVTLLTLLLLQGWWMTWNAHSFHQYRTWTTVNRIWDNPLLPDWPGAIDRRHAHFSMLNLTALAAMFIFACDLMARPTWRKRVWVTMALTVASLAVGGIVMKLGGPESREWLWGKEVSKATTTFAAYRYHGNAASMLSLGWALAIGFAITAASQQRAAARFAGWMGAVLFVLFGLFLNTSRAGWGLAILLLGMLGVRFLMAWWRTARDGFNWKAGLVQGVLVITVFGTMVFVAMSDGWKEKLTRLNTASATLQERYPVEVYQDMAREVGWLGHGPDCFQMVMPLYMEVHGQQNKGFWRHAHNDYYEYLANWGRWGVVPWVVLVLGGLWLALRNHFALPVTWGSVQWTLGFCGCAAMIGILVHARWDFPLEKASILLYFLTLLADGWARHGEPQKANVPA